ncbi:MAG: OmpA family protein [Chitinophagaceae bacterium]
MSSFKSISLRCFLAFLLSAFAVAPAFAQSDSFLKKVSCDCDSAILIKIFKLGAYSFTKAPSGFGRLQEITAKNNTTKTAFEQEHNSAWYLLEINNTGEMIFEITPKDKKDDYDFLLFPYKDSTTCAAILKEKIKPVRGNLSRNDTGNNSVTGLSAESKNEFSGKGVGAQFSKSINVKAGEKYLLVLDNVYENGKGHKLTFSLVKDVVIAGQVQNEEGKPVAAEVTLFDNKGSELLKTNSNVNGEYKIETTIKENLDYSLMFTAENSFFATRNINTKNLKDSNTFANIKTVLPKLKKGEKYKVGNLNFWPGSPELVARSLPSVSALYHLMKKNKGMKILIEGHVNNAGSKVKYDKAKESGFSWQLLSDQRSETIFNYLKEKGIDESRMNKIGYGDSRMLYPYAENEYEREANRRVEIKVISLNGE